MKIVHIIFLDKFTQGLVSFFSENFKHEMSFIICGNNNFKFETSMPNLHYIDSWRSIDPSLKKELNDSDLIVLNGIFDLDRIFLKIGLSNLKKSCFCFWGGDFYPLKNKEKNPKKFLSRKYKLYCIKNAAGVINLIPEDYNKLSEIVKVKGKHFVASVCDNGEVQAILEKHRNLHRENKDTLQILVGNSATETNQHLDAFDMLKKFKDDNILIICPLSYGDMQYGDHVEKIGTQLFGGKFIPLRKYLSPDEYYKILSDIDVAIFNNNRQQAMGAIHALLFMGAKVYIRRDTAMWNNYKNELNFNIFDIAEIENADLNKFRSITEQEKIYNSNLCYDHYSKEEDIKKWNTVFDSFMK